MRQLRYVFSYCDGRLSVHGSEEEHVPVVRKLLAVLREEPIEFRMEYDVVLDYQYARGSVSLSVLDQSEVTLQTSIRSREVVPTRGDVNARPVDRLKAGHVSYSMLRKP